MKRYLAILLLILFSAKLSEAQMVFTYSPSPPCYQAGATASMIAQVLASPQGATSFSWTGMTPSFTCFTPFPPINFSPDGSLVGFNFFCCGVHTLVCTAYDSNNQPLGSSAAMVSVSCGPSLTITAVPAFTICSGQTGTVNATGASSYTWNPSNSISSSVVVTPTSPSTYTILATNQGEDCPATRTLSISRMPAPTLTITSTAPSKLCKGNTATLTVSGANSYAWNTTNTTSAIVVTPSTTTDYSVFGASAFSCTNSASYTQSVIVCVGLSDNGAHNLARIFPNPFEDVLFVGVESLAPVTFELYDCLGRKLLDEKLEAGTNELHTGTLPKGCYFALVRSNGSLDSFRLVRR